MIAFTICSCNFLAQAQVLHNSLRLHNKGVMFYVALCDSCESIDANSFPFTVLLLEELGIPALEDMIQRYSITELNTAIKPFVFSLLFERHPDSPIVYFDPDIYVKSPLVELSAVLEGGADCVLVPHLRKPVEFGEMTERQMLNFGVYNLGFCALRGTPEVKRVVEWWGRRLESECVIDLPKGLFVDQKWADLFPGFIARTHILRHPGYNVGYWNLTERTVRFTSDEWEVNRAPLRFIHFSGSVVDEEPLFSRHSAHYHPDSTGDTARIFSEYVEEVRSFGREYYRQIPYAFSWDGASGPNLHTPAGSGGAVVDGSRAVRYGTLEAGSQSPHLPLLRARSLGEYRDSIEAIAAVIGTRRVTEDALVPYDRDTFSVEGTCAVCGAATTFHVSFMYASGSFPDGRKIPNWREHLNCARCGFVNRIRASLHLFFQQLKPEKCSRIYITEQVTPLYRWLEERFPNLVGSEYMAERVRSGYEVGGIRHEDIQELSFQDNSFDFILSFDVLEHVADEQRAFAELARCLKPGGTLFFTVPFNDTLQQHEVRAVLSDDGTINHILPPEYHGNPVNPKEGALCYRYYGWELMKNLSRAGFSEAEAWFFWSRQFGYLGTTNNVFTAKK